MGSSRIRVNAMCIFRRYRYYLRQKQVQVVFFVLFSVWLINE